MGCVACRDQVGDQDVAELMGETGTMLGRVWETLEWTLRGN
jgi:hypothetical protein